jgi:hypothetical protein
MNNTRYYRLPLGFILLLTVLGPVAHAEPSKADVNRALGG